MNAAPEISVVIEWENVLHFEKERSEVVLHCLAERIHDLDRAVRLRLEQVPRRAIMGIYHGFACVSAVSTWLAPGPMPHRFRP